MKDMVVNPGYVADWEDVARILFSPLFISEGVLSQRAFMLEDATGETYNKRIKGGTPQSPLRLLARMQLVRIAQEHIRQI